MSDVKWKLVPVEPTEEMVEAAAAECFRMKGVIDPVMHVWDAMLAAAPSPAASPSETSGAEMKSIVLEALKQAASGGASGMADHELAEIADDLIGSLCQTEPSEVSRKPYDMIVKRLLNPPFGTETSERLLMGTAADAIRTLLGENASLAKPASEPAGFDTCSQCGGAGESSDGCLCRSCGGGGKVRAAASEPAGGGVRVKELEWHKSCVTPWQGDYHTVPTGYSVRCADENGWKWQGLGAHGYAGSPEYAMQDAQAHHEARILSALSSPASSSPVRCTICNGTGVTDQSFGMGTSPGECPVCSRAKPTPVEAGGEAAPVAWRYPKAWGDGLSFTHPGDCYDEHGNPVEPTPLYALAKPAPAVEAPETRGPYEARICKGMPTDCCDYGVVSLSEGREVCRVWREQDARAIAAALATPAGGEDGR